MNMDLSVMYLIQRILGIVKKEMDEKHLSFDEFLKYWDDTILRFESINLTEKG